MVDVSFATGELGLLQCTLTDGRVTATPSASNVEDAASELLGALDAAASNGVGECFWPRASGVYRWLIRREPNVTRLAVLWSAGTMTGWESLFWAECDWVPFEQLLRGRIAAWRASAKAAM
jgi:hypothetical protein